MASRHLTLRIGEHLFNRLEKQSRRERETVSELARRLIDEGLRMEKHPGIVFRDTVTGRQPALADGPKVWVVASVFRELTGTRDEVVMQTAQLTGLSPRQVEVAVGYYSEYREEIDAWLQTQEEYAEAAYAEWLREQAVLSR